MKKLFQWFKGTAENLVPEYRNSATLFAWMFAIFGLGATFGASFPEFIPNIHHISGKEKIDINAPYSASKACDDISEFSKLQAVYKSETDPVIARWVEATREIERSDLLPSEHDKKMASQGILRNEIERMQTEHSKALASIAQACNSR